MIRRHVKFVSLRSPKIMIELPRFWVSNKYGHFTHIEWSNTIYNRFRRDPTNTKITSRCWPSRAATDF